MKESVTAYSRTVQNRAKQKRRQHKTEIHSIGNYWISHKYKFSLLLIVLNNLWKSFPSIYTTPNTSFSTRPRNYKKSKSACQPANRPFRQNANQPVSQPASQPACPSSSQSAKKMGIAKGYETTTENEKEK